MATVLLGSTTTALANEQHPAVSPTLSADHHDQKHEEHHHQAKHHHAKHDMNKGVGK
jgi:hypothetical protein